MENGAPARLPRHGRPRSPAAFPSAVRRTSGCENPDVAGLQRLLDEGPESDELYAARSRMYAMELNSGGSGLPNACGASHLQAQYPFVGMPHPQPYPPAGYDDRLASGQMHGRPQCDPGGYSPASMASSSHSALPGASHWLPPSSHASGQAAHMAYTPGFNAAADADAAARAFSQAALPGGMGSCYGMTPAAAGLCPSYPATSQAVPPWCAVDQSAGRMPMTDPGRAAGTSAMPSMGRQADSYDLAAATHAVALAAAQMAAVQAALQQRQGSPVGCAPPGMAPAAAAHAAGPRAAYLGSGYSGADAHGGGGVPQSHSHDTYDGSTHSQNFYDSVPRARSYEGIPQCVPRAHSYEGIPLAGPYEGIFNPPPGASPDVDPSLWSRAVPAGGAPGVGVLPPGTAAAPSAADAVALLDAYQRVYGVSLQQLVALPALAAQLPAMPQLDTGSLDGRSYDGQHSLSE